MISTGYLGPPRMRADVVAEVGIKHMLRAAALQRDLSDTTFSEQVNQALQQVQYLLPNDFRSGAARQQMGVLAIAALPGATLAEHDSSKLTRKVDRGQRCDATHL